MLPFAAAAGEMDSRGFDSAGREFSSATEMWAEEIGAATSAPVSTEVAPPAAAAASSNGEAGGEGKRHEWYSKGIAYWQVRATRALAQPAGQSPP